MDRFTEKLSEYLDGELGAAERAELESHIEECFECRRVLSELRAVVSRAGALQDRTPERDLWPGVAAAIGAAPVLRVESNPGVVKRKFAFTLPQLAAASVALMVFSGSLVFLAVGRGDGGAVSTAAQPAETTAASLTGASAQLADYASAVRELERVLREQRRNLDPVTVAVLEENLRAIDAAIVEANLALQKEPGDRYLNQHLENTMKKKIQLLRRAAALGGART
jgi:predicted anti-sigma-YlaC factor YlaD